MASKLVSESKLEPCMLDEEAGEGFRQKGHWGQRPGRENTQMVPPLRVLCADGTDSRRTLEMVLVLPFRVWFTMAPESQWRAFEGWFGGEVCGPPLGAMEQVEGEL